MATASLQPRNSEEQRIGEQTMDGKEQTPHVHAQTAFILHLLPVLFGKPRDMEGSHGQCQ